MIESLPRSHCRRSAAQWRELIDRQADSGLSQKAFCAAEGIALSTFTLWKRRLGEPGVPRQPERASPPVEFTPLRCPPGQEPDDEAGGDEVTGWEVELELGGGLCLRLRRVAVW